MACGDETQVSEATIAERGARALRRRRSGGARRRPRLRDRHGGADSRRRTRRARRARGDARPRRRVAPSSSTARPSPSAASAHAMKSVIALVVQPGVDMGNTQVFGYDKAKAAALSAAIDDIPGIVYEAHSTDFQTEAALADLVASHFAILKVGSDADLRVSRGGFRACGDRGPTETRRSVRNRREPRARDGRKPRTVAGLRRAGRCGRADQIVRPERPRPVLLARPRSRRRSAGYLPTSTARGFLRASCRSSPAKCCSNGASRPSRSASSQPRSKRSSPAIAGRADSTRPIPEPAGGDLPRTLLRAPGGATPRPAGRRPGAAAGGWDNRGDSLKKAHTSRRARGSAGRRR